MNVLDENIPSGARRLLQQWSIPVRQIGYDIGRAGMKDETIIPFLRQLQRPTLFSRDPDFYRRYLCYAHYCLVYMDVVEEDAALYVRRTLRHPHFNTQAKRMGAVIRAAPTSLTIWYLHAEHEVSVSWLE